MTTSNRFTDYACLKQTFEWLERERDIALYNGWPLDDLEQHAIKLVDDCTAYDEKYGGDSFCDLQGIK